MESLFIEYSLENEAGLNKNLSFSVALGGCLNSFQHAPTSDNHWKLKHLSALSILFRWSWMDVFIPFNMLRPRIILAKLKHASFLEGPGWLY